MTFRSKPTFEHRHYKAIARVLADIRSCGGGEHTWTTDQFIDYVADGLRGTNPVYDRARFVAAATGKPSNGRDRV